MAPPEPSPEPRSEAPAAGTTTPELVDALGAVETFLLGEAPHLTRVDVAREAGVPLEVAEQLWSLMGFAHAADDDVAFTAADVDALRTARELVELGILSPDRQAALVRTWGRSFARLAEWQTDLLAEVAVEQHTDPAEALPSLTEQVLPRVEQLQSYVWRRHLASAGARQMSLAQDAGAEAEAGTTSLAVGFVDIVGYTSRSRELAEEELVSWLEEFESATTARVLAAGGRVIKNIGDEVLFVADDAAAAALAVLELTARGEDEDDAFPRVRAGLAHGPTVSRLGDVFGPTVNVAARLTSAARPGTVLLDEGAHDTLAALPDAEERFRFRRLHRLSVKGYSRLAAYAVRLRD